MGVKIRSPRPYDDVIHDLTVLSKVLMQADVVTEPRYLVVPDWFAIQLHMPRRRSTRKAKKTLKKRLYARARRAMEHLPQTASGLMISQGVTWKVRK